MNKLDLKTIEKKIKQFSTITKKLDYWYNYFNKYCVTNNKTDWNIINKIFGKDCTLHAFFIPEYLYKKYFEPYHNTPEYTYWFILKDAVISLNILKKEMNIEEKINSALSSEFIKVELKKINEFEEKAKQLINEIDIYKKNKKYLGTEKEMQRIFLRIIDKNYYRNNTANSNEIDIAPYVYAKYVLLKNYLLEKHSETNEPPQPIETKQLITMEANNPLKNYHDFIWHFDAFFNNCSAEFKTRNRRNFIISLCKEMMKEEIYNIAHRAKQEIENLIFTNNNNSEMLIKSVYNDCLKLDLQAQSIMNDNNLNSVDVRPLYDEYFYLVHKVFYDFFDFFKEKSGIELKQPHKKKESDPQPEPLQLKEFFNSDCTEDCIKKIQNKFKDYKGKKMAIVIYLLQTEFRLVSIIYNSKTQSRKHFIRVLKNDMNIKKTQSIDKVFTPNTDKLNIDERDNDFVTIKNELNIILSK